jgi:hypothetical protein
MISPSIAEKHLQNILCSGIFAEVPLQTLHQEVARMLTETQIHAEAAYRTERVTIRRVHRTPMRHGLLRRTVCGIATVSRRHATHQAADRPGAARPAAEVIPSTPCDVAAGTARQQPQLVAAGTSEAA